MLLAYVSSVNPNPKPGVSLAIRRYGSALLVFQASESRKKGYELNRLSGFPRARSAYPWSRLRYILNVDWNKWKSGNTNINPFDAVTFFPAIYNIYYEFLLSIYWVSF